MSANDAAHEHDTPIKTPQQLIVVTVLAFVVPVVFLIMFAQFILSTVAPASTSEVSAEALVARIQPVADVNIAAAGAGSGAARTGEEITTSACAACHSTGAAGAPKIGDKAAWAPRIAQGLKGMLDIAIKGKNAMPPRGGLPDLSDFELSRAIVFMANQSGASLKEPVEPRQDKATE